MATPFSYTDAAADYVVLEKLPADQVYAVAADTHRLARQAEARTVLLAARIFDAAATLVTQRDGFLDVDKWDKAAIGEVSLHFGISRTKAGQWITLTNALSTLPAIREAYLNGEFTTYRTQLVCDAIGELDADTRAKAEPIALDLARRASADPTLRKQLSELIILIDPDAAADLRDEFAARNQNISIRDDIHGHSNLSACVPAEVGVHIGERIAHLVSHRVCGHDGRRIGQQRVVALAELMQVPGMRLACECGDPDTCAVTATSDSEPVVTEATDPLGETFDDETAAEMNLPPTPEPVSLDEAPLDPAERDRNHDDLPAAPLPAAAVILMDPAAAQVPWLHTFGPVDPAHVATMLDNGQATATIAHDPLPALFHGLELDTDATLVDIRGSDLLGRDLGPPIDPTGHGGLRKPTKAATRYRPSDGMRERIYQSDRTCRYPFCSKPSDECELDHIVPFNHTNPTEGGWTIGHNLAPLCKPDHDRKHFGIWIPTMHPDRVIAWHNPKTGRTILTYPR